jgi:hypothetical protein
MKVLKHMYVEIKGKKKRECALVVHACNSSYSGGRDQENCSLKPAWAGSSQDPILKTLSQKNWTGKVAQDEGPEFKSLYHTHTQK